MAEQPMPVRAWEDRHRPRFHFVAPAGWLNDPNGMTQWRGRYHLFFQYNPDSPRHERICWGHASSPDLVRWTDEPIALEPGPGPDRDGCWSGVLVDDGGIPTIIYSGHVEGAGQRPCLAVGSPDLRTWRKHPANPVIASPPPGLNLAEFRDHCVWRTDRGWQQLIGAGIRGRGGAALLYTSPDLRSWDYVGPILVGDAEDRTVWTGSVWECVDLFRLDPARVPSPTTTSNHEAAADPAEVEGTDVLVFSAWHDDVTSHSVYALGRFDGRRFVEDSRHHLDYGMNYFYAPQSMRDAAGRRILLAWVQEGRPASAQIAAGWSGVMSLPRLATLGGDGLLRQTPVPELARLRTDGQAYEDVGLQAGDELPLGGGNQLDLEITAWIGEDTEFEVDLLASPDSAEQTRLVVGALPGTQKVALRLDRTASSRDPGVDRRELGGRVPLGAGRRLDLRVLVDRSVLEVFANGCALTARAYPTRLDADRVRLRVGRGQVSLHVHTWRMDSIWGGARSSRPAIVRV
ncbi:MAG: glycoside hydrolase family 32 protein [Actinomycetes bacterium]